MFIELGVGNLYGPGGWMATVGSSAPIPTANLR